MNYARLFCLIPLAYIVWWFYKLFTWIVPAASGSIGEIGNATWIQIISIVLFCSLGIIVLIVAFIAFFIILLAD